MLNSTISVRAPRAARASQRGIVLLLALILMGVLTLAGIALLRSVFTSNAIAGNLAFQQGATSSSDVGVETAVTWLQTNNTGTTLEVNATANGYLATRQDPASGQSWSDFWDATLKANAVTVGTDAAGNTVMYVIQRLCNTAGPSASSGCSVPPIDAHADDGSKGGGDEGPAPDPQVYYRITTQVKGPRNTTSFVQSTIAL